MKITFEGGLNENTNPSIVECQAGYNFDLALSTTDLHPRRPLDTKGASPLSGNIAGILQLIKRDDSETTLIFDDDGATPTIYEWDGAASFTSRRTNTITTGSKLRDTYWSLDDYIVISDTQKLTPLLKWDGTTCSRLKVGMLSGSAQAVSGITRAASVATVTTSGAHGYSSGDLVSVIGADQTDYNIEAEITVTSSTTFIYTVSNNPVTPATGTITADIMVNVYARYAIVHLGRVWIFNVRTDDGVTDASLPHMCVASAFEDPETFDSTKRSGDSGFATGNEAFYVLTPDLKEINGVAVFNKQLVISTEQGRLFILSGNDSSNFQFIDYFAGSAAIGTESIVNMGNDVIYMRRGGNIDTLRSTNAASDVNVDDISRWIPDTVKDLSESLCVYDQSLQKVLFFVTGKVLVLFKDILYSNGEVSPWSVYKTDLPFNFNTSAAKYMRRPNEDTWSVYIGDSSGNIYDFNGVASGDNGVTEVVTSRKSAPIPIDDKSSLISGRVQYRREGDLTLSLIFDWSDAYNQSQVSISLNGPPTTDAGAYFGGDVYFGGDFYFNQGFSFSQKIATKGFSPTGRSTSVIMETYLSTVIKYQIDHIEI